MWILARQLTHRLRGFKFPKLDMSVQRRGILEWRRHDFCFNLAQHRTFGVVDALADCNQ